MYGYGHGHRRHHKQLAEATAKEAAENTITFLGDQISWARKLVPDSVVLDLGSGNKGAAFSNATRFGCKVVRFNLGVVGRLPSPRTIF